MSVMNRQASRLGNLQLEVDQERAAQLARALAAAAAFSPDPTVRVEALQLHAWVIHRRIKRWGELSNEEQRQRGTSGGADSG